MFSRVKSLLAISHDWYSSRPVSPDQHRSDLHLHSSARDSNSPSRINPHLIFQVWNHWLRPSSQVWLSLGPVMYCTGAWLGSGKAGLAEVLWLWCVLMPGAWWLIRFHCIHFVSSGNQNPLNPAVSNTNTNLQLFLFFELYVMYNIYTICNIFHSSYGIGFGGQFILGL